MEPDARNVAGKKRKRNSFERQLSKLYEIGRAILESFKEDVNLSSAGQVFDLPFPSINNPSHRFSPLVGLSSPQEEYRVAFPYRFAYIGRSRYESLKTKVLSLYPVLSSEGIQLKVFKAPYEGLWSRSLYMYGTTGSGKSHLLAALACELYATFSRVEGQNQRVLYIHSCQYILLSFVERIKVALKLAYCENRDVCATIDSFKNENDLLAFFEEESKGMTCIYFLVDDYNAIDQCPDIKSWLRKFSENHIEVLCASPTSENLQTWQNKKHYEEVYTVFGGLNADEYDGFKKCLPGLMNLDDMTEESVKHLTGSIPLFLNFWKKDHDKALISFLSDQEIVKATQNIKQMMVEQLGDEKLRNDCIRIYLSFLSNSKIHGSTEFDWRYTYVDQNQIGYVVCGYYMQVISDVLHSEEIEQRNTMPWDNYIKRLIVTEKKETNPCVLGYLVEQYVISYVLKNGLVINRGINKGFITVKCDRMIRFSKGDQLTENISGGVLYVPYAFNYRHIDMLVRYVGALGIVKSGTDIGDSDLGNSELCEKYMQLKHHIFAIQVTIGDLKRHLDSEKKFFAPENFSFWYCGDLRDVGRFFLWIAKREDLVGNRVKDFPEERSKTRQGELESRVVVLEHVTVLVAVEDLLPLYGLTEVQCFK